MISVRSLSLQAEIYQFALVGTPLLVLSPTSNTMPCSPLPPRKFVGDNTNKGGKRHQQRQRERNHYPPRNFVGDNTNKGGKSVPVLTK